MLEKASKAVWDLILDENGLGKEISGTVEKVFCRLSGREPPLFPLPNGETHPGRELANDKGKGKEVDDESEKERSNSTSKKRNFRDMNAGEENEVASKSDDPPSTLEDGRKSPLASLKT